MNRIVLSLGAAALVFGVVGVAAAADIPPQPSYQAPPAPPPSYFSWTGCYLGAQIGGQWGRDSTVTSAGPATGIDATFGTAGFIGGGHIGCNYQTGAFVLGIEGDIEASGWEGSYLTVLGGTSFDSPWQGSLRGRLGYAFDRHLLYVTGGLAFARLDYTYLSPIVAESFSSTKAGWTVGAGWEYAFAPSWSARVEYRYADFGRVSNTSVVAFPGSTFTHDPDAHAVRLGLTYYYGAPLTSNY